MAEQRRRPGRPPGSKNKKKNTQASDKNMDGNRLRDEIWAIIIIAVGAFLVIALQTLAAGQFGIVISNLLKGSFGGVAYILPYYLIVYGLLLFTKRTAHINGRSISLLILIFLMITILNSARFFDDSINSFSFKFIGEMYGLGILSESGGAFGMTAGYFLIKVIGKPGLFIFSIVVIIISIMLVVNSPVTQFIDKLTLKRAQKAQEKILVEKEEGGGAAVIAGGPAFSDSRRWDKKADPIDDNQLPERDPTQKSDRISPGQMKIIDYMKDEELFDKELEEKPNADDGIKKDLQEFQKPEEVKAISIDREVTLKPEELNLGPDSVPKLYKLPPIGLLNKNNSKGDMGQSQSLKAKAVKLEQTLQNFNVDAKVIQVTKGPAVTRYEIQPNVGVKVNSIVRLADDIALNLEAKSIRIEAPIPGKAAVGIEVENERVNLVSIREIIESGEFKNSKSKISFAVGKDIAGKAIVADLKSMPHMLIAGSTGSGKSVCINSIIISLIYKAKPDEVKLVLIDPKVVELNNYNGIPHLLIPVVTEPSKAAAALNWAVVEMTDRYKKFADEGVRDLESYNRAVKERDAGDLFLPQIVIIIDELADLMMAAPSQVEESICRLAQMARAAGMHLIVATQRPSVDIITGVIKANIPSRIAFAVSSQFDSRTILDMGGAEKLVGKGDMLFSPIGTSKPIRVQGTFISDKEVHKVIDYVKDQMPETEYATDVIHTIEKVQSGPGNEDEDELLPDAIEAVVRAEQASVSMLQRRFRIGYNRAARLVDCMEARGIIGPADGSRPRKVFMTEAEFLGLSSEEETVEQE